MDKNIVLDKSFDFSVRVVNLYNSDNLSGVIAPSLYKYLYKEKKEYVLSKQLLRSGTSIGANINEAQAGQSKNDFIAKMAIATIMTAQSWTERRSQKETPNTTRVMTA